MLKDIKSMLLNEISDEMIGMGQKPFRGKQIFKWLHDGVHTFDEMTNLPLSLRELLSSHFYINTLEIASRQVSSLDNTVKHLWRLLDGNCIESVFMRYNYGNTVCISSQVGCRMGCTFCASTINGLVRNLTPSEMLDQVIFTQLDIGEKISNIVLMGIGEPLDNFENVMRFLTLLNHEDGLNIGMRHVSLSTCAPFQGIDKLGQYNLQLTLSVSLHAPDDDTRSRLMPINRSYGVDKLFEDCDVYFARTGRRVSYEYALISGVNDTPFHAKYLVTRLRGKNAHVNLIMLNHVEGGEFSPSREADVELFCDMLKKGGVSVTLRRSMGSDIDAACGQLRRKNL